MIRADKASLTYLDHGRVIHACRNIEMDVGEDEFVGILGPSGSGKSSLLFLLTGLKDPTSGCVAFEGRSYEGLDDRARAELRLRQFGFVFQQPYLLGYLTALENVMLPNPHPRETTAQARALLETLGLSDKAHRLPGDLSGGEKQRVCVARALFGFPRAIFADEPTALLDHAAGWQVVELLAAHRRGALVMVTHDPSMLRKADRIYTMEEGKATEMGTDERARASS